MFENSCEVFRKKEVRIDCKRDGPTNSQPVIAIKMARRRPQVQTDKLALANATRRRGNLSRANAAPTGFPFPRLDTPFFLTCHDVKVYLYDKLVGHIRQAFAGLPAAFGHIAQIDARRAIDRGVG
jgi:hypothetical protein